MARRSVLALAVACAVVMVAGCSHQFIEVKGEQYVKSAQGQFVFYSPDARASNATEVFGAEYELVNATMRASEARALGECKESFCRPKALVGLGLSGGGLRSNAFQLGLLSALHEANATDFSKDKNKLRSTALDNIAYLSSVSGGTWAAASMMAYKSQRTDVADLTAFFSELKATVIEDRRLARCATGFVTRRDDCPDNATRILNNSYEPVTDRLDKVPWLANPFTMTAGYTAREAWRELLLGTHLLGRDRLMNDMVYDPEGDATIRTRDDVTGKAGHPGNTKPFWIINATHSAYSNGNNPQHFNFQITPLGVGTMADCGNTRYCGFTRRYTGFFYPFDKPGRVSNLPPIAVSHAMAISGAVFPERILGIKLNMFEWDFPVPEVDPVLLGRVRSATNNTDATPMRGKYTLADGGHSENLGALALMERGVDLLIISDAGFDDNYTFGDYFTLQGHAKKLLNARFEVNATGTNPTGWVTNPPPLLKHYDPRPAYDRYPPGTEVANATQNDLAVYFDKATSDSNGTINAAAYLGEYCFEKSAQSDPHTTRPICGTDTSKRVIYLRPPYNIDRFKTYLVEQDNILVNSVNPKEAAEANANRSAVDQLGNRVQALKRKSCAELLLDSYGNAPDSLEVAHLSDQADQILDGIRRVINPDWSNGTIRNTFNEVRMLLGSAKADDRLGFEVSRSDAIMSMLKPIARRSSAAAQPTGEAAPLLRKTLADEFAECLAAARSEYDGKVEEYENAKNALALQYIKNRKERANKPDTGYLATYHYLNLNRTEFPRDKTFVSSYDRELIFAYFLLGKYMGEEKLVPLLKEYLEAKVPR